MTRRPTAARISWEFPRSRAKEILSETGQSIGMSEQELESFVDAFEHGERDAAKKLI
jgi:hypothetical protein